ncbi:MAG TPA: bifunctional nuclease domain-containing protein [Bacteroidota bacterium]|nr:bifunctional nuclease domain-containing protein [Bacteroidota bacterium]
MDKIQVDILGLSTSPSSGGAYALILKEVNGARRLPIIIGAFEAQSIALEMEGIKPPRPLTHDLMKAIIDTLGGGLNDVFINELRDGTFYAKLSVDSQEIDSRPSDAIALAVRFGVPIFVADKVMEEAGFVPESEDAEKIIPPVAGSKEGEKEKPKQKLSKLEQLQHQLAEAVVKEEYEKAAKLRDEIQKLQARNS